MSTFYETPIRSNELYHWKYKDRFKRNGRWVYIYDDGSMSEGSGGQYGGLPEALKAKNHGNNIEKVSTHKEKIGSKQQTVTDVKSYTTNPNRLFTKHYPKESYHEANLHAKDNESSFNRTDIHRTEYGRLHMAKMNTKRKLSELGEKGSKSINSGKKRVMKMFSKTRRK